MTPSQRIREMTVFTKLMKVMLQVLGIRDIVRLNVKSSRKTHRVIHKPPPAIARYRFRHPSGVFSVTGA